MPSQNKAQSRYKLYAFLNKVMSEKRRSYNEKRTLYLYSGFYKSGDEAQKILTEEQKSCFLACMFKRTGIVSITYR